MLILLDPFSFNCVFVCCVSVSVNGVSVCARDELQFINKRLLLCDRALYTRSGFSRSHAPTKQTGVAPAQ